MLLSIAEKPKLPRLNIDKEKPKGRQQVDDTLVVERRMKELFTGYSWKVITTEEQLLAYLVDKNELGFDTETTGLDVFKSKLCGISLGTEEDAIYIPLTHKVGKNYSGDIKRLGEILNQKNLYGFNLKFDLKSVKKWTGVSLHGVWCGYLAARLMNSAEPSNEMKELYIKYVDAEAVFYNFKDLFAWTFDNYDPAVVGAYAAVDAIKHIRLGKRQLEIIGNTEKKLLMQLELPLAHELVDVELTGIKLDLEWCKELIEALKADLDEAKREIAEKYQGLNPGSPKQVAEWLYDKLKLPMIDKRGTGEGILKRLDHPLPQKILEYRKAQKLLSTYADKMPKDADGGIIHTTYNQYGADTGRFSSEMPNLQNIPRDNRFRKMFTAREGKLLVSGDYTQQEIYILAALANDETMIEAYAKGYDFYAYMASIVFNVPYESCLKHKPNAHLRDQMKSIVLALNYDKGIWSLSKDIGKSIEETEEIYRLFYARCPKVKLFRKEKWEYAKKHGYVETILGRRRYFTAYHKSDFECEDKAVLETLLKLRSNYAIDKLVADARKEGIVVIDRRAQKNIEERQIVNSVIQGSAADITKLAMLELSKDQQLKELGMKILLQVHDEVIAEFPEENAKVGGDRMTMIMREVMSDLIGIPVQCEPRIMKSWEKD